MSLGLILLILLIILLLGGFSGRFGGYGYGFLLEWDPTQPWVNTKKGEDSNPLWLAQSEPDINRPHKLLPYPDGKTLVLAGTPGYGFTGGGLLFWDREKKQATLVKHMQILPEHSTMSLAPRTAARFILLPMIGCASVALDPMMKSTSLPTISPMEFVIAPEPSVAARPATVGACQVRAQWSMEFVLRPALVSLCRR